MSERSELFFPRENNVTPQAANNQQPVLKEKRKSPKPNPKQAPNNWPQTDNRKNTGDAAT